MLAPSPEQVEKIIQIGLERAPAEACGIFTLAGLHELPNISSNPTDGYEIDINDLSRVLTYEFGESCSVEQFVVWHTHPTGFIGPSKRDIQNRVMNLTYCVVALPDGPGVLF